MLRKSSILLLTIFLLSSFGGYHPDDVQKIKFLYIKNFIKNIEWPQEYLKREFKIGVLGNDKIYSKISMANIRPDHVNAQSVAYYFFESENNLKDCHLIYIPKEESHLISSILDFYSDKPILIVTESDRMCSKGSMINFTADSHGKLSFEYNKKAILNAGLEYSAKFMEQGHEAIPIP